MEENKKLRKKGERFRCSGVLRWSPYKYMYNIIINGTKFTYISETFKKVDFLAFDVWGAYSKPSAEKVRKCTELEDKCNNFGGHGFCVTAASAYTFSCRWLFELDGESFQVIETKQNTFLYGPKTKTIADQIEEVRRERRKQKRALKEYQRKRAEEVESFRVFISEVYEDLKDIMEDNYKDLYKIIEAEAFEFCEDLEIIKPWFSEAAEILNQYKTE